MNKTGIIIVVGLAVLFLGLMAWAASSVDNSAAITTQYHEGLGSNLSICYWKMDFSKNFIQRQKIEAEREIASTKVKDSLTASQKEERIARLEKLLAEMKGDEVCIDELMKEIKELNKTMGLRQEEFRKSKAEKKD